jgi:hypothetical protein
MKYIITESKLNQTVKNYLNNTLDVENINWTHLTDKWGNDEHAIEFYLGDYMDNDETLFRLYGEEYWNENSDYRKPLSPMLYIESQELLNSLEGYFNDNWKEGFKEWFVETFKLPVNTVDYYIW